MTVVVNVFFTVVVVKVSSPTGGIGWKKRSGPGGREKIESAKWV